MSVQEAALNFLLKAINQLFQYNYDLSADVKESLKELQLELGYLQGFLKDFSKYNPDSEYLKVILKEISDIIYVAEDAVESFVLLAAGQKSKNWMSRAFHPKRLGDAKKQIAHVGHKVKQFNEGNIKSGFRLLEYQANAYSTRPRIPTHEEPQVWNDRVIGLNSPAIQVKELLLEGPKNLEVISIAGMPGLGKTTLACMVYNDPDVTSQFDVRVFVNISREYDKTDVLLRILESFAEVSNELRNMSSNDLEERLYRNLKGKRYLMILDDVCELKDWETFKRVFPDDNKGCRVLITTTNARLAERANSTNPDSLYMLSFLSQEESKLLLCRSVFDGDVFPDEFQPFVPEIIAKCGGLPLAILIIAGILKSNPNRSDWWEEVSRNVDGYISMDEGGNKATAVMYEHLPNLLKPCFIYLGVFPQDFDIPVWKLKRLWISEGFIEEKHNSDMEDVAEYYLSELVKRNLVVVRKTRSNGRIKTCRLHIILREFCRKEASKENLYHEIQRRKDNFFLPETSSLDDFRRLIINNSSIWDYMSEQVSGKHVRSFLTFQKKPLDVQPTQVSCILKAFKLLRVLEAQSLIFPQFPPDLITNLLLLKYLAISSSDVSIIPSSISRLWSLQTLIISTTSPTLTIEMELWKMPHFRHLHCNAPANFPSPSIDKRKRELLESRSNVQTLCTIAPESCTSEVFKHTPMLKKLGIRGRLAVIFESGIFSDFKRFEHLKNLKLETDEKDYTLHALPSESDFPKRLTKLTLMNTRLKWDQMSILGRLEDLKVLKLKIFAFQGNSWDTQQGGFRQLFNLYIGETDLRDWRLTESEASANHFPKLNTLELNHCRELEGLPKGLEDITSLKSLVLNHTNSKVVSDGRKLVLKHKEAETGDKRNILELSFHPVES